MTKKTKETEATTTDVVTEETKAIVVPEKKTFSPSEIFGENKQKPIELKNIEIRSQYKTYTPDDKPSLRIGGNEVELKEVELGHDYFFSHNKHKPGLGHYRATGNFSDNEISKCSKTPTWFAAEVNELRFLLTEGSKVNIERFDNHGRFGVPQSDGRKQTVMVGWSTIEAESLIIREWEENKLYNSVIKGSYIDLGSSSLSDCYLVAETTVDLENASLTQATVSNCKSINIRKTHGSRVSLHGFGNVRLNNVNLYCTMDKAFIMELPKVKNVNLNISDVSLGEFKLIHYRDSKDHDGIDNGAKIVINKRIDYGYIAGLAPVPFVKVGNSSILVGEKLFTSTEMLGKTSFPQFGEPTPMSPWFPAPTFGTQRALDPLVSKETANKAYCVTFNNGCQRNVPEHQPDQIVIDMVQTVIDQIKSKVKVYALMETLLPNGDCYDDDYPY